MRSYGHEGSKGCEPTYRCVGIIVILALNLCVAFSDKAGFEFLEFSFGICFYLEEPLDSNRMPPGREFYQLPGISFHKCIIFLLDGFLPFFFVWAG